MKKTAQYFFEKKFYLTITKVYKYLFVNALIIQHLYRIVLFFMTLSKAAVRSVSLYIIFSHSFGLVTGSVTALVDCHFSDFLNHLSV